MKVHAPRSHPRYLSNYYRDVIVNGIKQGIVAPHGLIAHGRGETFDYLIGEKTHSFAKTAICQAVISLIQAKYPVISVNGNTSALVPYELVELSKLIDAPLEINLFHASKQREKKIFQHLKSHGATNILLSGNSQIPTIESNRKFVNKLGQGKADVVFVPLEDGDRTEALLKMGKKVITIDLNPLSRTAQYATITIVDNIIRALPLLIQEIKQLQKNQKMVKKNNQFNNKKILKQALQCINCRLT